MSHSPINWDLYWESTKNNGPLKMVFDSTLKFFGLDKILAKRAIKISYDLLKDIDNPVIVEAGCGTATLSLALKELLQGAQLILIDISQEILSRIEVTEAISLLQDDITSLSLV